MTEDHGGRLHHIRAGQLDPDTAQSGGMRRAAVVVVVVIARTTQDAIVVNLESLRD